MTVPNAMPRLTAVSFQRRMSSGRTGALLMQCVSEDGDETRVVSAVVKSGGNAQLGGKRVLFSEALGAQLALYFDLNCPPPAVVAVSTLMAHSVTEADVSEELRRSVGKNFGTLVWPELKVFQQLSDRDRAMAANVFAFDVLTENTDRQSANPNLFLSGKGLVVLDHEFCCRWDDQLFPGRLGADQRRRMTSNHALYRWLRGTAVDFQPFLSKLAGLSDSLIASILMDIPDDWHGSETNRIVGYLSEKRNDIQGFERTLLEAIV